MVKHAYAKLRPSDLLALLLESTLPGLCAKTQVHDDWSCGRQLQGTVKLRYFNSNCLNQSVCRCLQWRNVAACTVVVELIAASRCAGHSTVHRMLAKLLGDGNNNASVALVLSECFLGLGHDSTAVHVPDVRRVRSRGRHDLIGSKAVEDHRFRSATPEVLPIPSLR